MDEIAHLFWLAKQCRDKAREILPSFRQNMYLRRAKYLEARARRARRMLAVSARAQASSFSLKTRKSL